VQFPRNSGAFVQASLERRTELIFGLFHAD
jgi:hypothetical protein